MADYKLPFRHLTKRVTLDKEPVTYRLFAREFGLDVDEAKVYSIMEAYIKEPQAIDRKVVASWLLAGKLVEGGSKQENGREDEDKMDVDMNSSQVVENGTGEGKENGAIHGLANGEEKSTLKMIQGQSTKDVVRDAKRVIKIVHDADLEATTALFLNPPTKHIYSISPDGSATTPLSFLSICKLATIPSSASAKWKVPEDSVVDYGSHKNLLGSAMLNAKTSGEGDRKGKGKEVVASASGGPTKKTATTTTTTTTSAPERKPSVNSKSSSTSKASTSASTSTSSKPAARPMGQLGGLFAKKPAEDSSSSKTKKRKASPPPAKAKSKSPTTSKAKATTVVKKNGIFEDEFDEDDDEEMDEEAERALREIEEEAEKKKSGGNGKGKGKDDKMDVDPPAPKAAAKKVEEPKKKQQGSLNGFFKKS